MIAHGLHHQTEEAAAARAAVELEGLTLKPRISAMARNLRSSGDRDRLARPRTDKTQVQKSPCRGNNSAEILCLPMHWQAARWKAVLERIW